MSEIIKDYSNDIIRPIEDARKELINKIYSRNIFDIIFRKRNKELLEKYDELWFKSLKVLEELMEM